MSSQHCSLKTPGAEKILSGAKDKHVHLCVVFAWLITPADKFQQSERGCGTECAIGVQQKKKKGKNLQANRKQDWYEVDIAVLL